MLVVFPAVTAHSPLMLIPHPLSSAAAAAIAVGVIANAPDVGDFVVSFDFVSSVYSSS